MGGREGAGIVRAWIAVLAFLRRVSSNATMAIAEGGAGLGADPALEELRRKYLEGDLVLFAGAGVSAAAGLPSWGKLVDLLSAAAAARGALPDVVTEIGDLRTAGKFIDALSLAKETVGEAAFGDIVEHALDDQVIAEVPEVGQAIAALGSKLRAVLTTNVDHLLERAFLARWPVLYRATASMARRKRVILKLHGTLFDRSTWVFTRDQYDRAMYNDALLSQAFSAIFLVCPVLFVGYGLTDDDFDQVLTRVRALSNGQPSEHFALVPEGSFKSSARKLREDAGVRIITYPTPGGSHAAVPRILRWLVAGDPVVPVRAPLAASTAAAYPAIAAFESMAVPSPSAGDSPADDYEAPLAAPGGPPTLAPPPLPPTPAVPPPPGAPYDARWYVHRPAQERQALEQLETPGTPVTVWGPERFGKTLLLRYLLDQVRDTDADRGRASAIIEMDLQRLVPEVFSFDALCENLAAHLVEKTGGDKAWVAKLRKSTLPWPVKLATLMEDRILPAAKGRVVLAVDEADALWREPGQHGLYRMFRSWCEKANEPGWAKLRFVFLLSTTSSLAFEGPNHKDSPFNLGSPIELPDLGVEQIVEFAWLRGMSVTREDVEGYVLPLVGGHPFLLHVLMYSARLSGRSLHELVHDAEALDRLFGNELSELARLIEQEPKVAEAVRSVLGRPELAIEEDLFLRLRRSGLVTRSGGVYSIRYGLYREYLRRRWPVTRG